MLVNTRRGIHAIAGPIRLTIRRGDLADACASALVTSANDSLVGNCQPTYWRFISRTNADGAIRKRGGTELEEACLALEPHPRPHAERFRRDITRWTSGVKHGDSLFVRCPAGSAVTTKAYGRLRADYIVHAVAPDSEFGYEGMYTGGLLDQRISGAVAGNDTPTSFAGGHLDGHASQQFTPPDDLLLCVYQSALMEASRNSASSVALCALGAGVKGWKPAISAALALEAVARCLGDPMRDIAAQSNTVWNAGQKEFGKQDETLASTAKDFSPTSVEFVLGGVGRLAEDCWLDWVRVANLLLGRPSGLDTAELYATAAATGTLSWDLDRWPYGTNPKVGTSPTDNRLDLSLVGEMREMWAYRTMGKNGRDDPLTSEQELAATRRRTTR